MRLHAAFFVFVLTGACTGDGDSDKDGTASGETDVVAETDVDPDDTDLGVAVRTTVDAGAAQTVDEGEAVALTGTVAPNAEGRTFRWAQQEGDMVALEAADGLEPTFVAPPVAHDTLLRFTLDALEGGAVVASDDTSVLVRTTNTAPVVDAGPDQDLDEGLPVILLGTATDADGVVVDTTWIQLAGPQVSLADADTLSPSFMAPEVSGRVTLLFRLLVTDEDGAVGHDEVEVEVSSVNEAPVVNAGLDQVVLEQTTVSLSGTAVDSDGSVASTLWVQTGGPLVTLDDATALATTFQAPATGISRDVSFRLEAVDDEGALGADHVSIRIDTANTPPEVDAGPDQAVMEGDVVTLTGAVSDDGTVASHRWVQVAGPAAPLDDSTALTASFTAPGAPAVVVVGYRLEATDDDGATASDTVYVTVTPINATPVVEAGPAQTVDEGDVVVLAGVASDVDGAIASVQWTQLSGPPVVFTDATVLDASFEAPGVAVATSVVLLLTATDDDGASAYDSVTITVRSLNAAPVADAGLDQQVLEDAEVRLLGVATDADGVIVRTTWTQVGGTLVSLSDASELQPTFTAPLSPVPSRLTFELEVEDDEGITDSDRVDVFVDPLVPLNQSPVVYAGADRDVGSGTAVGLLGTAVDVDGTIESTTWTQVEGPEVALTDADTLSPQFVAPVVTCATVLVFELRATDDLGAEATDRVAVVVEGTNLQAARSLPMWMDLEDDDGGMAADGSLWAWGVATTGPITAWAGTRVWATNLGGNYADGALDYACLPPIDLTGSVQPVLSFRAFLSIASGDAFIVEGLDPTAGWVPLTDAQPVPSRIAMGLPSWSSTSPLASWWLHTVNLPAWLGDTGRLRLVLAADNSWVAQGAYLDEIRVDEEDSDPDNDGIVGIVGEWLTHGTDPFVADHDEDGTLDGDELVAGTDPLSPGDYPGVPVVPAGFLEDFEADDGGLVVGGGTWEYGAPSSGPGVAASGSRVWATVLGGNYRDDTRAYLYLPPVDLGATSHPTLAARMWLAGSNGDGVSVEFWDADTRTWEPVVATSPSYDSTDAVGLPAWRSQAPRARYELVALSLDAHAGDVVRLRFALRTDGTWVGVGAYLDDLAVFDEADDPDGDGLPGILAEIWDGTDPFVADTDGDGRTDGEERAAATDPTNPAWFPGGPALTPGDLLDFEAGPSGLVASRADWNHGVFASGPGSAWSGSQGWATNLSGNYTDRVAEYVYLPPVDLGGVGASTLSFRLWLGGQNGDGLSVEAWDEATGWATLLAETPIYDATDAWGRPAWRYQTDRGDYVWAALPLDAYAGDVVLLRLAFRSDGSWVSTGAYVDDLAVDAELSDPDQDGLPGILDEYLAYGTDPYLMDTDGDGYDDGLEVIAGTDPLNEAHHPGAVSIVPGTWLDFELDDGGLVPDRSRWQVGNPASGPGAAHSGSRAWATNLSGNYADNVRDPLLLPPVDLAGATSPTLSFRLWMAGHNGDGFGVDAQLADGSWTRLVSDEPTPYESVDALGIVSFRSLQSGAAYTLVTFDLSPWVGTVVPIRLMLRSDGGWNAAGAYVDDLRLDEESSDPDGDGLIGIESERATYGTDPYLADTDGDGVDDLVEVTAGSDPLDPLSVP